MKRLLAVAAAVFCLSLAVPASAHHMAEDIVSDDMYDMIEDNLEGSPHLELDLDLDTMAVITVTVMEEDVDEVLANLEGSPYVDLDVDPMGVITVTVMEEDVAELLENLEGSPYLGLEVDTMAVITVTVMEEDEEEALAIVRESISDYLEGTFTYAGESGEGDTSRVRRTSLELDISEPTEEDLVTIMIYKNIGQATRQEPETQ